MRAVNGQETPLTTRELSEMTFLLSPSLSRITANLATRGLLNREANPSDQRSSLLSLSRDGEELLAVMAADSEAGYHAIEQSFGSDRLKLLYNLLDDLAATRIAKDT